MQNKNKTFAEEFTNQYSISKTLRFALRPVGKTREFLGLEKDELSDLLIKDKNIQKSYKEIKLLLDDLHSEFIEDSMIDYIKNVSDKGLDTSISSLYNKYLEIGKLNSSNDEEERNGIKSKKKEYDNLKKDLIKNISGYFKTYSSDKYESFCLKSVTDKSAIGILKDKYTDNKTQELLVVFDGFTTYLSGYNTNRGNYYEADKKGSFAHRVVEEIMPVFFDNVKKYENKYKNKDILRRDNLDVFDIKYFGNLFLQDGIDKYNSIIAGQKNKENKEEDANAGFNSIINHYSQQLESKIKSQKQNGEKYEEFNKKDYPKFKEVYKQIGSTKNRDSLFDGFVTINNDQELIKELLSFGQKLNSTEFGINNKNILDTIKSFNEKSLVFCLDKDNVLAIDERLKNIYLKKTEAVKLSNQIFGNWAILHEVYKKKKNGKYEEYKDKDGNRVVREEDYVSLLDIKRYLNININEKNEIKNSSINSNMLVEKYKQIFNIKDDKDNREYKVNIFELFIGAIAEENKILFEGFYNINNKPDLEVFKVDSIDILEKQYIKEIENFKNIIKNKQGFTEEQEKEFRKSIKNYLDRILNIYRSVKIFENPKDEILEADTEFYDGLDSIYYNALYQNIYKSYDDFRNYITKAHLDVDKFKLNFDSGTLLNGFVGSEKSNNKIEFQYKTIILRKKHIKQEYKYFIGILKDGYLKPSDFINSLAEENNYCFMEYYQISSSSTIRQRCVVDEQNKKTQNFTKDYKNKIKEYLPKNVYQYLVKKDEGVKDEDNIYFHESIDYYKKVFRYYYEKEKGIFVKFKDFYKSFKDFEDHIKQSYSINFNKQMSEEIINKYIDNGELYLFEIYNKDFSDGKKEDSKENLHTTYFKELFSEENLKNPIFKLSGEGEMFFRDKLENYKQKAAKVYAKDKDGNYLLDENGKKYKIENEEGIKEHKRYAQKQISLHLSIVLNNVVESDIDMKKMNNFNNKVNEFIKDNSENINIIGIDRGEKHLLYYSLIDSKGNIIPEEKIRHLDCISGVNYQEKLGEIEIDRLKQRETWNQIEGIKNMKLGYLSLAVKEIVDLAIKYNAIIVLEDLNWGFKTGRQHIEKSIYQQFEKALINKLSFVVDKNKQNQRIAPQLSAPFETFEKIGKQTGIVYYVPAKYTSRICPSCNWQRDIYLSYSNSDNFIKTLKDIKLTCLYEKEKDRFVFSYKNNNKNIVKLHTDVDRLKYSSKENNGKGGILEFSQEENKKDQGHGKAGDDKAIQQGSMTYNFKNLFTSYIIKNEKGANNYGFNTALEKEIMVQVIEKSKDYIPECKRLFWLLNILLDTRNSINTRNEIEGDYISCPRCHFDTRKENTRNGLPIENGDANGAYNIARKGLYIIEKIKNTDFVNNEKVDMYFKDEDYRKFLGEPKSKK